TTFLAHESTLDYRSLYWQPRVFAGTSAEVGRKLHGDGHELLAEAREIARGKIASNAFALADDVRREVDKVYRRGVAAIMALPG
ncbi:MAG TPA: hypothetical protein VMY39_05450, partial [Planctomycetota bacterium]|nr:hypothetical protein [Planctomycetota bacterium]